MKLELSLFPDCPHCRATLTAVKDEEKNRDKKYYGTRNLTTGTLHAGYVIRPDRNSEGIVTHWHLDRS